MPPPDTGGVYCEYPAIRGDRLCFLYTGSSTWHDQRGESTLGLATLRLDGFVSVQSAGFTEGVVVARPYHWSACELRVNVQSPTSDLKVQLQDETGRPFDGFSTGEMEAVRTDAVDAPVSWKGKGRDLRELTGRMVLSGSPSVGPEDRLYSYALVPASD